jgi:hypothetical protein
MQFIQLPKQLSNTGGFATCNKRSAGGSRFFAPPALNKKILSKTIKGENK